MWKKISLFKEETWKINWNLFAVKVKRCSWVSKIVLLQLFPWKLTKKGWFIYYFITNCYLQNVFDAKIVWNCRIIHSISFNVALVTSALFTDYKVPMPRINIQNFLEETCKSVHKWLLSIPNLLLDELHVYCEVINQCLELGFLSIKASHLTGIYLDHLTKSLFWGKIEMFHWSF